MEYGEQELQFSPGFTRFLLSELSAVPIAVAVAAVGAFLLGRSLASMSLLFMVAAYGFTILYHAAFFRSLRRLTFGPDWIRGPCANPSYGTTVQFDRIDWSKSGVRRRQLRLVPRDGESIRVKLAWFSPEQREAIRREIRARADLGQLPESLRY